MASNTSVRKSSTKLTTNLPSVIHSLFPVLGISWSEGHFHIWIPWLLRYLHRQSSHRTADNLSCWCSTWRLHINLLKAPHLKVGRLAFETITGKFRPQKHHWRSHLVRQVCMWCNQVIILQDPGTENTTIVSSYSTDHVSLWSHDLSWLFSCSLMGKPSGVVRSWATHNGLI